MNETSPRAPVECIAGRGENPCDRCGKPTSKKTDILCPDCGRAHINMLDIDPDERYERGTGITWCAIWRPTPRCRACDEL